MSVVKKHLEGRSKKATAQSRAAFTESHVSEARWLFQF